MAAADSQCIVIEFGAISDLLFALGAIAIPAVAIPVIARVARRHPSQAMVRDGRRAAGIRVHRWGLLLTGLSLLGIVAAVVLTFFVDPTQCEQIIEPIAVVGVIGALIGALLIGGGWAWAVHAAWVVLATIAVLDAWIFYLNVLIGLDDPDAVRGLLLLAFAIHGVCTCIAARWSFVARDLGPIERAKAGEAGRTLAAVWVFLAAYTGLTLIRSQSGIFDTTAGSAVLGALTLGALAVTMGSGFTKYAEAIHARPAGPRPTAEPAPKQGAGPEPKPDAGPEPKPDARPDGKPGAGPDPKQDATADPTTGRSAPTAGT